jgi:predicted ATPase
LGLAREILKNLRTHRVAQFGALYLGAAWILLEVAALLEQTLELPNWVDQSVLGLLVVGFPIGLIVAWFQASQTTDSDAEPVSSDPTAPKTAEEQLEASAFQADFPDQPVSPRSGGNLPIVATSFIGREAEVAELKQLLGDHRLVTLTGVGGVGKTRLALSVAEELATGFADGVWMVELAPVGDPAAVPAAVATALGITAQAELSITAAIAEALSGRDLLLVLDNCEHVLDAAADVVEALLTRTTGVSVLATSREGLRVAAEHLWPVPSLDVRSGESSKAVSLFVERARAVQPGFTLGEDVETVVDICKRLDGIALAIELAAARMVSMNPRELLDRLADRFRLLSGSRRGLERHQTLRHAVQWSYDLLAPHEASLLSRCSVFSDGFDLVAAAHMGSDAMGSDAGLDEYAVLDALDSLVRKSLVTAETARGETRYTLLETIRQFGEEQLAQTELVDDVRRRHAGYFAKQAVEWWRVWDGPDQRDALDWVQVEFANLRSGYEWAADRGELGLAAMIAAHSAIIAFPLQQFEPIKWSEELIPGARAVHLRELGLLYGAAVLCAYVGRKDESIEYGRAAVALHGDDRYDTFDPSWNEFWARVAIVIAGGDLNTFVTACEQLANGSAHARTVGLFGMFYVLPACGRADEAIKIAADVEAAARAYGNPFWIGWLHAGYRAFTETDPEQALRGFEKGLSYARHQQLPFVENRILQELAWLEGLHGVPAQAAELFDDVLDAFLRAGNHTDLRATLCYVAMFFDRLERPEIAATIFGASRMSAESWVVGMPSVLEHLRDVLGVERFDACVDAGTAMEPTAAVHFAREKIRTVRGPSEDEE